MKLSELKKVVDDYILEHSADDEVMLVVDGDNFLSKLDKIAIPLTQKDIRTVKVCEQEEKITLSCAYSDECIPPDGVNLNDCANCPRGGYKVKTRLVPCKKYGKDVLAIMA